MRAAVSSASGAAHWVRSVPRRSIIRPQIIQVSHLRIFSSLLLFRVTSRGATLEEETIVKFTLEAAKALAAPAKEAAKKGAERAKIGIDVGLENGLKKYIKSIKRRYERVKTLLYADKAVKFEDIYVKAFLKPGNDHSNRPGNISETKIIEDLELNRIMITGSAGSGKSMIMRNLLLKVVSDGKFLPLFIELRKLNNADSLDVLSIGLTTVKEYVPDFQEALYQKLLNAGRVIFFLDGYDELHHEYREKVMLGVLIASRKYGKCKFILSTRPDEKIGAIEEITVLTVCPMNQAQIIELIQKLDYDADLKKSFIEEIVGGLYRKHQSFLSNPLLATMMLLTFEQYAAIPEKVHIFYYQAFETLYMRHDASKGQYQRRRYCNLSIDDFKTIFSNFCALSLFDEKFSFTFEELTKYVKQAFDIETEDLGGPDEFIKDLLESVCLLQKDGLYYTFVHRSFQEYFAACFLASADFVDLYEIITGLVERSPHSNAVDMLVDMKRDRVEADWVIRTIDRLMALFILIPEKLLARSTMATLGLDFIVSENMFSVVLGQKHSLNYRALYAVVRMYRDSLNTAKERDPSWAKMDRVASAKWLSVFGEKRKVGGKGGGEINVGKNYMFSPSRVLDEETALIEEEIIRASGSYQRMRTFIDALPLIKAEVSERLAKRRQSLSSAVLGFGKGRSEGRKKGKKIE